MNKRHTHAIQAGHVIAGQLHWTAEQGNSREPFQSSNYGLEGVYDVLLRGTKRPFLSPATLSFSFPVPERALSANARILFSTNSECRMYDPLIAFLWLLARPRGCTVDRWKRRDGQSVYQRSGIVNRQHRMARKKLLLCYLPEMLSW